MNNLGIVDSLQEGQQVFIKDDFYDMALRIERDNGTIHYFRKFRKDYVFSDETPINIKQSDTAFQVLLGGELISKEEYDNYNH